MPSIYGVQNHPSWGGFALLSLQIVSYQWTHRESDPGLGNANAA